jgi:preprotein translocase subunit SecB
MVMRRKRSPSGKLENIDMEAVSRVAKKADLDNIILLESKVTSDPLNRDPQKMKIEPSFSSEIISIPDQGKENKLPVKCHFSVKAYSREQPKNLFMSIEATFLTLYVVDSLDQIDKKDVEMFSIINPIYNVWPYWRELVQSFTVRMGYPALVIPLLKIKPKQETKTVTQKKRVVKEVT